MESQDEVTLGDHAGSSTAAEEPCCDLERVVSVRTVKLLEPPTVLFGFCFRAQEIEA